MNETLAVSRLKSQLFDIFDHLHQHPEVSWKEVNTTKYVASLLEEWGADEVRTFEDCPGVVAELGDGPLTVGLRSDMDALWQEVDGTWKANHSCGHDAHMTLALGVFMALKKLNVKLPGKVRFIFQPAEEKGDGALKMVEKMVIEDVDYLYGVHLRPEVEVTNGKATPAIVHGAGRFMSGKICGADGHGGRPHMSTNAIEVAATIVQQLNTIHLNPMVPYSVKMTKLIAGGENSNIIPGSAEFSLDLRAQSNQTMNQLAKRVEQVIASVANLHQVDIDFTYESNVVAAEVNEEAKEIMAGAIKEVLGVENLLPPSVTPGGEDFHFYSVKRPSLKATMLGLGCGLAPGLHHPKMVFDRESLIAGVEILTRTILATFEKNGLKVKFE